MEKKHLSVSQLKLFMRCPLSYYFRYIQQVPTTLSGALILGSSIHKGLEFNFKQKMETKEDLPVEKVLSVYSESFDNRCDDNEVFWNGDDKGRIKDQGIDCLSLYHQEVSPHIQPQYVEAPFDIKFDNTDYSLRGVIDLVADGVILDHKCVKRSITQSDVDSEIQLTAYSMAYRNLAKAEESGVGVNVMVKNKTPKIQQLRSTRTKEEISRFLRLTGTVATAIQTGVFYPCASAMNCSYCSFKDNCKDW